LIVFKMIAVAISVASAFGMTQNVPVRPVAMQDLTIPKDRLPAWCALARANSTREPDGRIHGGLWAGLPITTNPWTGTDHRVIASIRERADPPPTVTDAPLTRAEASRYFLRLADGVEEGYAAVYTQEGSNDSVVVSALRFAATEKPFYSLADAKASYRPTTRIEIGRIVAVVTGGGECFQALETYLKSLPK
jgi:hypothetical protein